MITATPMGVIWPCVVIWPLSLASAPHSLLCPPGAVRSLISQPCHFSLCRVVVNEVKRVCLFSPFSKTSFTTFCKQAVGYVRLKRLTKREKWAQLTNNESLSKEIMTAEKENSGFPSGWSDITRMLNLGYQGRWTTRANTPGSGQRESERDRKKKRERKKENVINHTTVGGPGLVEVFLSFGFVCGSWEKGQRTSGAVYGWSISLQTSAVTEAFCWAPAPDSLLPSLTKPHHIRAQTSCRDLRHSPGCNIKKLTQFSST